MRHSVFAVMLLAGSSSHAALEQLTERPLPDPVVMRQDGWWYITGTHRDLYVGQALSREALERLPIEFDLGGLPPVQIWGFSMFRDASGHWHGYGTIHYGYFRTVIAHFQPQPSEVWKPGKPITRWQFDKVLIGDVLKGKSTMYDQKLYRVRDELHLVYNASPRRHANVSILAQRMVDPQTLDASTKPRVLLRAQGLRSEDRNKGYHVQIVEGTTIREVNGKYLLLYSVGDYRMRNYKVGMAWSDSFLPKAGEYYQKIYRPDNANVWDNKEPGEEVVYLLQSQKPGWPNYCGAQVLAPGIASLVEEGDQWYLVFHGYPVGEKPVRFGSFDPRRRRTYKLPVEVNVAPDRPRHEWVKPVLAK